MARQRSSATPLSVAFALLVVYATLYPFSGWRWPAGTGAADLLALPWPAWNPRLDVVANLLGYLPLGALIYVATARSGMRVRPALLLAIGAPALMSYLLEVAQFFLPGRVPSRIDWVLNSVGAMLGAACMRTLQVLGGFERWQLVRDRWFIRTSAGALVLLVLWPVGLLFPTPVPLGVGQVWDELRELAALALQGTPWADSAEPWLAPGTVVLEPLAPATEGIVVALGLAGPCLVAFSITQPGWRRVVLAIGAALLALATTTLSNALNFGPDHALSWLTPSTVPGLGAGLGAILLCVPISQRLAAGLGLVALTGLVALVSQAPADPYYAQTLQAWEQGRFIRFHGLARWVDWLWPYAAMAWLLMRLAAREEPPRPGAAR
jgi:VanZ family protein